MWKTYLKISVKKQKNRIKSLGDETLGSFKNTVTTGDAAYLTKGQQSKNST